jgi:hypothetical protein
MKNSISKKHVLKTISTHALVAAVFTNPYLLYVLADIYKIATGDTSTVVVNNSLTYMLSWLSSLGFAVAIVSFILYKVKK